MSAAEQQDGDGEESNFHYEFPFNGGNNQRLA